MAGGGDISSMAQALGGGLLGAQQGPETFYAPGFGPTSAAAPPPGQQQPVASAPDAPMLLGGGLLGHSNQGPETFYAPGFGPVGGATSPPPQVQSMVNALQGPPTGIGQMFSPPPPVPDQGASLGNQPLQPGMGGLGSFTPGAFNG